MNRIEASVQFRRDISSNWVNINPVPKIGEPCFETNTGFIKIGDGVTDYNQLPYFHENCLSSRIFRGKNLGSSVTDSQISAIRSGTFEGLFLGDYWEIGGIVWRIVDFDYWYNTATQRGEYLTEHHLVVMPDKVIPGVGVSHMNSTSTTLGGYYGSEMFNGGLDSVKEVVRNAFGDLIIPHREFLSNSVTDGKVSGYVDAEVDIGLPSEIMMFGNKINSAGKKTVSHEAINCSQLALFGIAKKYICPFPASCWLNDVVSETSFASISYLGYATTHYAAGDAHIRPVFAIG